MKKFISIILMMCMMLTSMPSVQVYAANVSSDEEIIDKIDELYALLGNTYFNTNRNGECGAKSGGHGCEYCLTTNIVTQGWFKDMFGTVTTNQFPITYCDGTYLTRAAKSCAGFGSFAEWYIFKSSTSDTVNTNDAGTYAFNVTNIKQYAKAGDLIRFNQSSGTGWGHSGIFINATSNGMYILDCNGDWSGSGYYNCRVAKRTFVPSSTYPTFTISRATNRVVKPEHVCSFITGTESEHPHYKYKYCSSSTCGKKEYLSKSVSSSCNECYPVGNVILKRKCIKNSGTVTFTRNNVANAHSYSLDVFQDGALYDTYNMPDTELKLKLPNGNYEAVLYATNVNTGEERNGKCDPFTIIYTYKVSFDANGGTNAPASQTKTHGKDMELTSSIPKRNGYVFVGWAASKNAIKAKYKPGDYYKKDAKTTLYAVWEPEIYTIKFDANGGKGELEPVTITYGDTMKMPNSIVRDSYYLKGWAKTADATEVEFNLNLEHKLTENCTLYAVWGKSTWNGNVSASLSGSGTETDPYLISSAGDLAYLAKKVNSQTSAPSFEYYKLTENIDLGYNEWVPIGIYGNEYQYFSGSIDGNGFMISNLYITNTNEGKIGLFGYVKNADIRNLAVKGSIEGISSTSSGMNIGGLIGVAEHSVLNGLSSKYLTISALNGSSVYSYVGGLFGTVTGGIVENCTAEESYIGLTTGDFGAGLIAGYCAADMTNCSVTAKETGLFSTQPNVGKLHIGGLCGDLSKTAEKCTVYAPYFSNNIKTTASSQIGGLVGYLSGEIKVCTAKFDDTSSNSFTMSGTGSTALGGIAGYATGDAQITDCKFDGGTISSATTSGPAYVGGFVGQATALTNETATASGGQSLIYHSLPKKSGYKATWYTDSTYTSKYDFSQKVTSDVKLFAKWENGNDDIDIWDGSSKEPAYNEETMTYTITNGEELAWVADVANGVITTGTNFPTSPLFDGYTVELARDIYLNDVTKSSNWSATNKPSNIWKGINKFNGIFEGNNYRINGMYIYSEKKDAGFIVNLNSEGVIRNLGITNSFIYVIYDQYTAVKAGSFVASNQGIITNCNNEGVVKGGSDRAFCGGICGTNSGKIYECYNLGKIDAGNGYAGGIASSNNSGEISYCYNKGNVSGEYAGGIFCISQSSSKVEYCYNAGSVSGEYAGGLGSEISGGILNNCYNRGSVTGSAKKGEIVSTYFNQSNMTMTNCYTTTNDTLYNKPGYSYSGKITIENVAYKSRSTLKSIFNTGEWCSVTGSSYPEIARLADTVKTYTVTFVTKENASAINRAFANVDGKISGSAKQAASVGGAIGYTSGSTNAASEVKSIIVMADGINSTAGSAYKGYAGNIIGRNNGGYFTFSKSYFNTEMTIDSSSSSYDSTGISHPINNFDVAFYENIMGLTPYTSLENLSNNEMAVWVLKDGEMPELYYNCLNEVKISTDIENGTVTVDKELGIDGEFITVTAVPDENYVLNKIYVNGVEITGTTFELSGDAEVYATFAEKIPVYSVTVTANENASGSLTNMDAEFALMSLENNTAITANDGEEIQVSAMANENYTVDSICVNGEEIAGTSFILEKDSVVTMEVSSIDTSISATTYDATEIQTYSAVLGGTVEDVGEGTVRYIRYWKTNEPETIFITEVQKGAGEYWTEVLLDSGTEYSYQMTEFGEVKTFSTPEAPAGSEEDPEPEIEATPITTTTFKTLTSTYKFSISSDIALETEKLFVAVYAGETVLLGAKLIECDGDTEYTASFAIDDRIKYAKVFVWNDDSLAPLGVAETVNITK